MNKFFSRGASSVKLLMLLPLLILFLLVGFDFGRSLHARNTLANAVYVAMLTGWYDFYTVTSNWTRDANKNVIVDSTILNSMDTALLANKGPYKLSTNPPYSLSRCQCLTPPATEIVECNTSGIQNCMDGNLRIFLKVSAGFNYKTAIDWPTIPSNFLIGPFTVTSRVQ